MDNSRSRHTTALRLGMLELPCALDSIGIPPCEVNMQLFLELLWLLLAMRWIRTFDSMYFMQRVVTSHVSWLRAFCLCETIRRLDSSLPYRPTLRRGVCTSLQRKMVFQS